MRPIETGDMVSFDTDVIGPYGYCVDISRAWVCGARPSEAQRRLYAAAHTQVQHNIAILQPGMAFADVVAQSWPIPASFSANRYGCLLHGVGLADEWPSIPYQEDWAEYGYDGVLQPGMVVSVESYVGELGGAEGVKLEDMVLITETGVELLSHYPYEEALL